MINFKEKDADHFIIHIDGREEFVLPKKYSVKTIDNTFVKVFTNFNNRNELTLELFDFNDATIEGQIYTDVELFSSTLSDLVYVDGGASLDALTIENDNLVIKNGSEVVAQMPLYKLAETFSYKDGSNSIITNWRNLLNAGNTSASQELLECFDSIVPNTTDKKIVILADNASTIDTNNYQVQFFNGATQITSITATNILIPNNESIIVTVDATNVPLGTYEVKVISGIASNTGSCFVTVGNVTENPVELEWTAYNPNNINLPYQYISSGVDSVGIKIIWNYGASAVSNAINPNGEDFDLSFEFNAGVTTGGRKFILAWFGITTNKNTTYPNEIIGVHDNYQVNGYNYATSNQRQSVINGTQTNLISKATEQVQTRIIKRGVELFIIHYNLNNSKHYLEKIEIPENQVYYMRSSCHVNNSISSTMSVTGIKLKHL